MTTEPKTLTDEERAVIESPEPRFGQRRASAKLLRLYDAALVRVSLLEQYGKAQAEANQTLADAHKETLARVEAAEKATIHAQAYALKLDTPIMRASLVAAESRLAEALALLNDCHFAIIGRPVWGQPEPKGDSTYDGFRKRIYDMFHPSAAAPATTSLLCYEGDCAKMTGRSRPCPVHDPAPAAQSTAEPIMASAATETENDLLDALRECRAELERTRAAANKVHAADVASLVSARAERDTAREYAVACERTAALNQQENVTLKRDLTASRTLVERIGAELQGAKQWTDYAAEHIDSALTLIRAAKEGA